MLGESVLQPPTHNGPAPAHQALPSTRGHASHSTEPYLSHMSHVRCRAWQRNAPRHSGW